ncbi:2-phospho-L-lactate guanylyltransferase [Janibacter sp. G56]|uniref:2-phospho-L-lactate guanylyltransferase n=1 Tax=Janibacter sp. G56 TaxID=3418717 RepID=UPI003D071B71
MSDASDGPTDRAAHHAARPAADGAADGAPSGSAGWGVVVPVKGGPDAKSRLAAPDGVDRARLAHAIAEDTLAAVRTSGVGTLVVVTSDVALAAWAGEHGAHVVADPGTGLDAAVLAGLRHLAGHAPHRHRAVLLGDLPALVPAELAAALAQARTHPRAHLPDAEGEGTTLLTALRGLDLVPRFGVRSSARHASAGHPVLTEALSLASVRRDVDDADDLAAARLLGLGPRTAAVLTAARR